MSTQNLRSRSHAKRQRARSPAVVDGGRLSGVCGRNLRVVLATLPRPGRGVTCAACRGSGVAGVAPEQFDGVAGPHMQNHWQPVSGTSLSTSGTSTTFSALPTLVAPLELVATRLQRSG